MVSQELLSQIFEALSGEKWGVPDTAISAQFVRAFEKAHAFMATYRVGDDGVAPAQSSGAVGVAVVLRKGRALMAHAGDCRAILGTLDESGAGIVVDLTDDHKLETASERERIEATGAWIKPAEEEPYFSPARVYADQNNPKAGPGLTMSRSLGDIDADAIGVIATPEVNFREIDLERDRFIVLASDGLWEFLSSAHVAEIVHGFLERGEPAINATRFLIAKAALAWRTEEGDYRDDITCIVVYLTDLPANLVAAQ